MDTADIFSKEDIFAEGKEIEGRRPSTEKNKYLVKCDFPKLHLFLFICTFVSNEISKAWTESPLRLRVSHILQRDLKLLFKKKHGVINADRLVVMKLVHAENKELYWGKVFPIRNFDQILKNVGTYFSKHWSKT